MQDKSTMPQKNLQPKNMAENNETTIVKKNAWAELPTGKKIKIIAGGSAAAVVLGGVTYLAIRIALFAKARKAVEDAAENSYTADYAIEMAKSFKQFGGIAELLYDKANEYLPSIFVPEDSEFESIKKTANQLNGICLENVSRYDIIMTQFFDYFKQYTRKDFYVVAKKALDDGQYEELLGILKNKDKQAIAENSYADVQDDSWLWNDQNVVKYGKNVGDMPWTQNNLKNRIIMTARELDYTSWYKDGVIFFNFNGKSLNINTQKVSVPGVYRLNNSEFARCVAGATLGVLTGRVARPDIAWTVDDYLQDLYLVEFVAAWNQLKYWVNVSNVSFIKGKQNALKNIQVTAKSKDVINMSNYMLDKCKMLDGSALKGYNSKSQQSRVRENIKPVKLHATHGTFPVRYNAESMQPDNLHSFLRGFILSQNSDTIKFRTDKNKIVFIPKKTVKINE